jgi:superfamily II DNA or RNA helicase
MRSHQIEALEAWKAKGDFQGTFDLATGSGKTIMAIHAVVKLSNAIDGLACVIAVPYQNLADQWVDVLSDFNIYPVRCYVSRVQWHDKLRNVICGGVR